MNSKGKSSGPAKRPNTSLPSLSSRRVGGAGVTRVASANSHSSPPPSPPSPKSANLSVFKKNLFGDTFGTKSLGDSRSMLGILYRARVHENLHMKNKEKSSHEEKTESETSLVGSQASIVDILESDSDSDNDVHEEMNARLQLATTLRNWSSIPGNNEFVIREGGVHALIALAGLDDVAIRKCVVSALFHLSCRPENREELIALGATAGIFTISLNVNQLRSWKLAKLCALTLCNLSMQPSGEATMFQESAVFALVVLMGLRSQRLLPVCVQALYNLTCVDAYFPNMDRIVKSLINIPVTGFDHMLFFAKALQNCCRYRSNRSRMVEDGALASLVSFVASIQHRENKDECVSLVATSLRLLSDKSETQHTVLTGAQVGGIRSDMVSKGSIELLYQLLQLSNEKSWLNIIITVFNILHVPSIPAAPFETAVNIITEIISRTENQVTLQYGAACVFLSCKDSARLTIKDSIPGKLVSVMPKLLHSNTPVTQFFAIVSTDFIFFSNHKMDHSKIELLIQTFVDICSTVTDELGKRVVALFLAKLSQEGVYMATMERLGLLRTVMEIMLTLVHECSGDVMVQESACVAICRIGIKLNELVDDLPRRISDVMFDLLCATDVNVLRSTICSIRCLGEADLCHSELLSDTFLARVASNIVRHVGDIVLVRNCVAVLAVFSYDDKAHSGLAADSVMSVLYSSAKAEDRHTRELVSTVLCNISVDPNIRPGMVEKGVVEVLSNLSGSISQLIQELCAKCICNLTASLELQQKLIEHGILQTILMISLVRSVANSTKLLCARALLNLLEDANIPALKAAGAIRVFATLSTTNSLPLQNICARAFLIFTSSDEKREDIVSRHAVLHAVYGMVKCSGLRVNVMVGLAICNLLCCPASQKICIQAGGLSVLKIIASMDIDELTEATAKVIVNIILEPTLQPYIIRESVVPVLVLFLQHPSRTVFEVSIHALSCMCQSEAFHNMLIDKGCVTALVGAVVNGRINSHALATEVCRCLCLLSFDQERAEEMVVHGNILLAPHIIYRNGTCTAVAASMIALTFRNLSFNKRIHTQLLNQEVLRLLNSLYSDYKSECAVICKSVIILTNNLVRDESLPQIHQNLLDQGLIPLLLEVLKTASQHNKQFGKHHHFGGLDNLPGGLESFGTSHLGSSQSHVPAFLSHDKRAASMASGGVHFPTNAIMPRVHSDGSGHRMSSPHTHVSFHPIGSGEQYKHLLLTKSEIYYIARTLNLVSSTKACHEGIVHGKVVQICVLLLENDAISHSRHEIASALCKLSSSKSCRQLLVDQGAAELVVMLSHGDSSKDTQNQCSLALGFLSEITHVKTGVVGTRLLLSLKNEEAQEPEAEVLDTNRSQESNRRGSVSGRYSLMGEHVAIQSEQAGPKSLRLMIRDGLMHKKDAHNVVADDHKSNDKKHHGAPHSTHSVSGGSHSSHHQAPSHSHHHHSHEHLPEYLEHHALSITVQETMMLRGKYDAYKYTTIKLQSAAQPAGMAARMSIESIFLPSLSDDAILNHPDRISDLMKPMSIKDPLSKDVSPMAEYIGGTDELTGEAELSTRETDSASRRGKADHSPSHSKGRVQLRQPMRKEKKRNGAHSTRSNSPETLSSRHDHGSDHHPHPAHISQRLHASQFGSTPPHSIQATQILHASQMHSPGLQLPPVSARGSSS